MLATDLDRAYTSESFAENSSGTASDTVAVIEKSPIGGRFFPVAFPGLTGPKKKRRRSSLQFPTAESIAIIFLSACLVLINRKVCLRLTAVTGERTVPYTKVGIWKQSHSNCPVIGPKLSPMTFGLPMHTIIGFRFSVWIKRLRFFVSSIRAIMDEKQIKYTPIGRRVVCLT